jgi:RimJ/RimL family protein N-acetyltransferase
MPTVTTRRLTNADRAALEALLCREPRHNAFHLSVLREFGVEGPGGESWGVGAYRGGALVGAAMALRGTGGIYHPPGDADVLEALAGAATDQVMMGNLALLSGHASQIDPLLGLAGSLVYGHMDRCDFVTLRRGELQPPTRAVHGFGAPRLAGPEDMERLIDFYLHGFYSLARLPSRTAWRNRLTEQLAFRTLYFIEDGKGAVASAALSSAEGGGAAMLGGVATLDEYRGRGLSALCVGALCDHLFSTGTQAISLFYLRNNHAAARVYGKLGFRPAGEWLLAPVGAGFLFGNL